jgi:GTP1/Obg family GTP-binding protein
MKNYNDALEALKWAEKALEAVACHLDELKEDKDRTQACKVLNPILGRIDDHMNSIHTSIVDYNDPEDFSTRFPIHDIQH